MPHPTGAFNPLATLIGKGRHHLLLDVLGFGRLVLGGSSPPFGGGGAAGNDAVIARASWSCEAESPRPPRESRAQLFAGDEPALMGVRRVEQVHGCAAARCACALIHPAIPAENVAAQRARCN